MKLETFFEKFDQFADAPDAVVRMRELVLHLAVTGKLSEDSESWTELPLAEVSRLRRGYDLPTQDRKSGSVPIFAANGPVGVHESHKVQGPGVVTGRSGSIGKVHFINEDFWPLNTALYVEDFFGNYPQFICLLLRSLHLERFSTATAVPTLNRNVVHKEVVKVPPLAEQKRIVAKVDELMALCDRLEAQQQERETRYAALARASLARFADAPTPDNLQFLFHPSYAISPGDLRKSILTLAVQGLLVLHDVNSAEWEVRKLKNLTTKIGSGSTPSGGKESYQQSGVPLVRSMNVHFAGFVREGLVFLNEEQAQKLKNVTVKEGDVLLNITGASIGRVTTAPKDMDGARVNQHVCIVRPTEEILPAFLQLFFASPIVQNHIGNVQVGATREALTKAMIEQFDVPVPPLSEQRRIVAKVEQLMALVDELETQLAASRATATNLLSAIVAEFTTH